MKKQIIKIFILTLLIGCNSSNYRPKYTDFTNAWERENLVGKVKTLEQYKANVIDFETGKTETPIREFKKEYTSIGNISYQEHFDNFGKLEQYEKNEFDNNGFRNKSISENLLFPTKSVEIAKFDTLIGKQISAQINFNDTIHFKAFFKYDDHGNLIKQTNIQNKDTSLIIFKYKYDNDERIISKKKIESGQITITNIFTYDSKGNLIELIGKSEYFGEKKSVNEYDNKSRINKVTHYQAGKIEKEIFFDKYYNQTLIRFYLSNALHKETKYEYEFDKKGNWVQRDVFLKEHFRNKEFIPIYTETRKIEYFD